MSRTAWMLEHYLARLGKLNADRQQEITLEIATLVRENEALRQQLRTTPVRAPPHYRRHRHRG